MHFQALPYFWPLFAVVSLTRSEFKTSLIHINRVTLWKISPAQFLFSLIAVIPSTLDGHCHLALVVHPHLHLAFQGADSYPTPKM
jgi:hypothetical protein